MGIQVVMGSEKYHAIYVGKLQDAFDVACLFQERFSVVTRTEVDQGVSPPLDTNLYQLQKSLEIARQPSGETPCYCSRPVVRIGSDAFYRLAESFDDETEKTADGRDGSVFTK
jgi:hypothetical protein